MKFSSGGTSPVNHSNNLLEHSSTLGILVGGADKDDVSIHTLAAAAHQIIHDINQQKCGEELLFDSAVIKDEYRDEFISLVKTPMNFFKHADRDAEEILEFPPISSIMLMMFSIMGLEKLGGYALVARPGSLSPLDSSFGGASASGSLRSNRRSRFKAAF